MWGKMTDNYNQLSMGHPANISRMTELRHGFTAMDWGMLKVMMKNG
jgi:hypothetical protein